MNKINLSLFTLAFTIIGISFYGASLAYQKVDLRKSKNHKLFDEKTNMNAFGNNSSQQASKQNQISGHIRVNQTFRGLPIFNQVFIKHYKNGNLEKITGSYVEKLEDDIKSIDPLISSQEAKSIAEEVRFKPKKNPYTGVADLDAQKIELKSKETTLGIWLGEQARLAWEIKLTSKKEHSLGHFVVLIDAINGSILKKWSALNFLRIAKGFGGNEKTGRHTYGEDYELLDVTISTNNTCIMENEYVRTIQNHNTSVNFANTAEFQCPLSVQKKMNGAFNSLNDAHFYSTVTFEMFQEWFGFNPISYKLKVYANYGSDMDNGFFANIREAIFLGAGNMFHPLSVIDFVAHEIGHAVVNEYSKLNFEDEPGALNEAFADWTGETVENFLNGNNDFLFSADAVKKDDYERNALRNLCNPGLVRDNPNHYNKFDASQGFHSNAGIMNKAFCNLAKTSGWNVKKAYAVMLRANQDYWVPNITFGNAVCGILDAAKDLNDEAGREVYGFGDLKSAYQKSGVFCSAGADMNQDGRLSFDDLTIFRACVNQAGGSCSQDLDIDGSGLADSSDVRRFEKCLNHYTLRYQDESLNVSELDSHFSLNFANDCSIFQEGYQP